MTWGKIKMIVTGGDHTLFPTHTNKVTHGQRVWVYPRMTTPLPIDRIMLHGDPTDPASALGFLEWRHLRKPENEPEENPLFENDKQQLAVRKVMIRQGLPDFSEASLYKLCFSLLVDRHRFVKDIAKYKKQMEEDKCLVP